jgi:hypothetical protein
MAFLSSARLSRTPNLEAVPERRTPTRQDAGRSLTGNPISATTATGFARTPTGALVAAAQIIGHTATDPPVAEATIAQQWVAGPDRDKALAMAREEAKATPKPGRTRTPLQITGFRFVSYAADTAVVSLIYQVTGSKAAMTVTMRWLDDDWRMVPPPGGNWSSVMSVTDGSGVVEWGPR